MSWDKGSWAWSCKPSWVNEGFGGLGSVGLTIDHTVQRSWVGLLEKVYQKLNGTRRRAAFRTTADGQNPA